MRIIVVEKIKKVKKTEKIEKVIIRIVIKALRYSYKK